MSTSELLVREDVYTLPGGAQHFFQLEAIYLAIPTTDEITFSFG